MCSNSSVSLKHRVAIVLLGMAIWGTAGAGIAQFQTGDVVLGLAPIPVFPNTLQGSMRVYSAAGTFKTESSLPLNVSVESLNFHAPSLFAISSGPAIYTVSPTGDLAGLIPPIAAQSFVFDSHGNLYVTDQAVLKVYDSSGQLVNTLSLPEVAWYIDLAADQCTLYYISAPQGPVPALIPASIARYDVCTAQALAPLPTAIPQLGYIGSLRLLAGGDLLLGTATGILRIREDGTITRTYTGGRYVALDPDRLSFWEAGGSDRVRKIDLSTGSEVGSATPFGDGYVVFALTVVGEARAAVAAGAVIPTMSVWLLISLVVTLAMAGGIRSRSLIR